MNKIFFILIFLSLSACGGGDTQSNLPNNASSNNASSNNTSNSSSSNTSGSSSNSTGAVSRMKKDKNEVDSSVFGKSKFE